jgi:hypothetical protein
MRTIEVPLQAVLDAYEQRLVYLVKFQFSSTYYYTNCDVDVWTAGHQHQARGMEISPAQCGLNMNIDTCTVELDNADQEITAIVEGQEIRDKWCEVREAALSDLGAVVGSAIAFLGVVDSYEYTRRQAQITIRNIFATRWQRQVPREQCGPSCQAEAFKDAECAYSGAGAWCDRSWDRCVALGNEVNFRGYRWISDLMKAPQIWWGRTAQT